jgi:hypothetical protein
MIILALCIFVLAEIIVIFVISIISCVAIIGLVAASNTTIPHAATEQSSKLYNCEGDAHCARMFSSISYIWQEHEKIVTPWVILYSIIFILLIYAIKSIILNRSKLNGLNIINANQRLEALVRDLMPELKSCDIKFFARKDSRADFPFTINKTIYFSPLLLSDKKSVRFSLLHEAFHINKLHPYEKIFFTTLTPLIIAIVAIIIPIALFITGDTYGNILSIVLIIVPYHVLENLKNLRTLPLKQPQT